MVKPIKFNDKTGIVMMWAPAGEFLMGSTEGDSEAHSDERPQHLVRLTEGFWIGKYPVTNAEYGRFLEANPEHGQPNEWTNSQLNSPQQPVVGVSWEDAQAFCRWAELALPTEAQWEYACRAGTQSRYWSGDSEADLAGVGWYDENSGGRSHPVGEKRANAWGLHDMHGNVWEWCWDERRRYSAKGVVDPVGEGSFRVFRGGGWAFSAWDCRAAYRYCSPPSLRISSLGFRVVLVPGSSV